MAREEEKRGLEKEDKGRGGKERKEGKGRKKRKKEKEEKKRKKRKRKTNIFVALSPNHSLIGFSPISLLSNVITPFCPPHPVSTAVKVFD